MFVTTYAVDDVTASQDFTVASYSRPPTNIGAFKPGWYENPRYQIARKLLDTTLVVELSFQAVQFTDFNRTRRYKVMKSFSILAVIALCAVPLCSFAAQKDEDFPDKFEAIGQGTATGSGTPGCQFAGSCTVSSAGMIKGEMIGNARFTSTLTIDYTTYRSNGSGGGCAQASGDFIINTHDNAIQARQVGLLCEVGATGASAHTFNATYWIDPAASTGKFKGSSGSGNLTASDDGASGTKVLSHLDGVILLP